MTRHREPRARTGAISEQKTDEEARFGMSVVHATGESPGAGIYTCVECGWRIYLLSHEELPNCARCPKPGESRFSHFLETDKTIVPGT
jgi:hypothetical protein